MTGEEHSQTDVPGITPVTGDPDKIFFPDTHNRDTDKEPYPPGLEPLGVQAHADES